MICVNKILVNIILNKLNIFFKEDKNCNIVSICCLMNRCGEKILMVVWLGGRRELMLIVVVFEREK